MSPRRNLPIGRAGFGVSYVGVSVVFTTAGRVAYDLVRPDQFLDCEVAEDGCGDAACQRARSRRRCSADIVCSLESCVVWIGIADPGVAASRPGGTGCDAAGLETVVGSTSSRRNGSSSAVPGWSVKGLSIPNWPTVGAAGIEAASLEVARIDAAGVAVARGATGAAVSVGVGTACFANKSSKRCTRFSLALRTGRFAAVGVRCGVCRFVRDEMGPRARIGLRIDLNS